MLLPVPKFTYQQLYYSNSIATLSYFYVQFTSKYGRCTGRTVFVCKKVKVKCALLQALRLSTDRTVRKGSRGIVLLFLDHGPRRGWGVNVTAWPLFTPGKDPVPIVQEAGWVPGPVWTGEVNLATTGIRSADHPASSRSLYRLSYRPTFLYVLNTNLSDINFIFSFFLMLEITGFLRFWKEVYSLLHLIFHASAPASGGLRLNTFKPKPREDLRTAHMLFYFLRKK